MEIKKVTRQYAVITTPFTYRAYDQKQILHEGFRLKIGRGGYQRSKDGIVIVIGHGDQVVVPNNHFKIETEETTTIKSSVYK
jgi:hypothetical protein